MVLRALAAEGDAGDLAAFLLAEGCVRLAEPGDPDARVFGRSDDLLGQDRGDDVALIGWVAAMANGVTQAEGIDEWVRRAVPAALATPDARTVLWSEVRRGDLVIARGAGPLRAAIALDHLWGVRIGIEGIERISLLDLVGAGDGPYVLRDKLWFWASYGEAVPPDHLHVGSAPRAHEVAAPARGGAPLWVAAAAAVALIALFLGAVVGGSGGGDDEPPMSRRDGLFPLDELPLRQTTVGGIDLRWCVDGVPQGPYDGDLAGIRIRRVDVYGFDDDTLLVDVDFLEPLDDTMQSLSRRAVRGYALGDGGLAQGSVSVVEITPSGEEVRGQLTLGGVLLPDSSSDVAVGDHFQFFLELAGLDDAGEVQVAVDSFGGDPGRDGALPCHVVVTEPILLRGDDLEG